MNQPRQFNQALMDLGASICIPLNPKCSLCPWHSSCGAYSIGQQMKFPVKEPKKKVPFEIIGVGIIFNQIGQVLIDQRIDNGLLGGLWEFPGGKQKEGELIEETVIREIKEEIDIDINLGLRLVTIDHAYTHKKLRFVVYLCTWLRGTPKPLASQQLKWVLPSELSEYPFPAANTKIINSLVNYLKKNNLPLDF